MTLKYVTPYVGSAWAAWHCGPDTYHPTPSSKPSRIMSIQTKLQRKRVTYKIAKLVYIQYKEILKSTIMSGYCGYSKLERKRTYLIGNTIQPEEMLENVQ
jgi:hypothetical protein